MPLVQRRGFAASTSTFEEEQHTLLRGDADDEEEEEAHRGDRNRIDEADRHVHEALDRLRPLCSVPFDEDNPAHMALLGRIWVAAWPDAPLELASTRWKMLGFQGTDPRSDVRGAGLMGLSHFAAFLESEAGRGGAAPALPPLLLSPAAAGTISSSSAFPLAIASINCTALLQTHLHLNPKLMLPFAVGAAADAATLRGFLRLARQPLGPAAGGGASAAGGGVSAAGGTFTMAEWGDDEWREEGDQPAAPTAAHGSRELGAEAALEAMHARLLVHLARVWADLLERRPQTTLLDFPHALRATHCHLRRALAAVEGRHEWDLKGVVRALEEQHAPLGSVDHGGATAADEGPCDYVVRPASEALAWVDTALIEPSAKFVEPILAGVGHAIAGFCAGKDGDGPEWFPQEAQQARAGVAGSGKAGGAERRRPAAIERD